MLNQNTTGKFVLFNIKPAERVVDGPVMRGFVEIAGEGAEPLKIQVAAWARVARETGNEYLSLKVGNNNLDAPETYTIGPFYGRLFRQAVEGRNGDRVRYWGFVEDAERVSEDDDGRGVYEKRWELRINAKRAVSGDGTVHYISGHVGPGVDAADAQQADELAF